MMKPSPTPARCSSPRAPARDSIPGPAAPPAQRAHGRPPEGLVAGYAAPGGLVVFDADALGRAGRLAEVGRLITHNTSRANRMHVRADLRLACRPATVESAPFSRPRAWLARGGRVSARLSPAVLPLEKSDDGAERGGIAVVDLADPAAPRLLLNISIPSRSGHSNPTTCAALVMQLRGEARPPQTRRRAATASRPRASTCTPSRRRRSSCTSTAWTTGAARPGEKSACSALHPFTLAAGRAVNTPLAFGTPRRNFCDRSRGPSVAFWNPAPRFLQCRDF